MFDKESSVLIEASPTENPGATVSFPFDRGTVEQFRKTFPRARWRDDLKAWFVPGVKAAARLGRWIDRDLATAFRFADERGRDAFAFEPTASPYLEAADDLRVKTPYSRTIVMAMREIPWAAWDGAAKIWRVPFRSWDAMRRRWPEIEAAARRNEPEARRTRAAEQRASSVGEVGRVRAKERRIRRYPVPMDDLPPLGRVLMTRWGAVCFTEVVGECVEPREAADYGVERTVDLVWAKWRIPSLEELVAAWPARAPATEGDLYRGWWRPSREELRTERAKARALERSRETRAKKGSAAETLT